MPAAVLPSSPLTSRRARAKDFRLFQTLVGCDIDVSCISVFPAGDKVVLGMHDGVVQVWDVAHAQRLHTLGVLEAVYSVAVFPAGDKVVAGSGNSQAKVWDVATAQLLQTLEGYGSDTGYDISVAIFPDGSRVVLGSDDGTATIWDAATAQILQRSARVAGAVTCVAVFPAGEKVFIGSGDGTAAIWDSGWSRLQTFGKRIAADQVEDVDEARGLNASVAVFPAGDKLVMGYDDGTARIWDVATLQVLQTFKGNPCAVTSVAVFPAGDRVVTGISDPPCAKATIWHVSTAEPQRLTTLEGYSMVAGENPDFACSVAIFAGGNKVAFSIEGGEVQIWEEPAKVPLMLTATMREESGGLAIQCMTMGKSDLAQLTGLTVKGTLSELVALIDEKIPPPAEACWHIVLPSAECLDDSQLDATLGELFGL